ncbi:MAG: hypothetical protein B7Y45_10710 [Sphingomonas sp. 28-66-16]|nr:MAG: hypothetical protein B7Y45_10710 [Sphingomonas sp. 28-66-16]
MERPASIVRFELFYLGYVAIGAIGMVLNWSNYQAMPAIQDANAAIGSWYLPVVMGLGTLIPVLLWYFVARQASSIAKWIVTAFFVLNLIGVVTSVLTASFPNIIAAVLGIAGTAAYAVAVYLLFRPASSSWFTASAEVRA